MKVLIITEGYFPGNNYGGPPVSLYNLCKLLNDKIEFFIITKDHNFKDRKKYDNITDGWNKRSEASVLYCNDSKYNYNTFVDSIIKIAPDFIYLQSVFQSCVLSVLFAAKKYNITVLLAPRGELCLGAFKKKYKKIPYIYFIKCLHLSRNVIFQSTSDEESAVLKKYFPSNRIVILNNVPTLTSIRKDYSTKKNGEAKLVFISRIVWKKNLLFALQVINRVNDGSLQFDIYGPIEEPQYWEECLEIINNFRNNIKVNYCGVCKHNDIPIILSGYDALFFPTFSENYGHIIAESLSVGLPIIISDQTPWSNINSTKGGWAIPLKNDDMYLKAVESIIGCSSTEMRYRVEDSIAFFEKNTNIDLLRNDYLRLFSSLK